MDWGLGGMKMDKRDLKEFTRMVEWMDWGLGGMKMDKRNLKEFTRMGKRFLQNVGMKMEMIVNVVKTGGKIVCSSTIW